MKNHIYPENIISQLKNTVESGKQSEILQNSNGGNSILLVCPPDSEIFYIDKLIELMPPDIYNIIDVNDLLVQFVNTFKDDLPEMFDLLKGSIHQIFKAPEGDTYTDFFKIILTSIEKSFNANLIPILIHTGALYGSGIDSIHLMENKLVMKAKIPLIILYPGSHEKEQLLFLNSRPASKYRCLIIN